MSAEHDADWLAVHLRPFVREAGYRIWQELRKQPLSTAQLHLKFGMCHSTIRKALRWLVQITHAPIKRNIVQQWDLIDRDWCIPWGELPPECQVMELERVVAPGAETNLLDCISRLQRENRELRERLMKDDT